MMTHDDWLKLVWESKDLLLYHEQIASMPVGEFLNWYELAPVEDIFNAIDPVLYSHKPADLARVTGLSINTIYALRKRCNRNKKPTLATTIELVACGVTTI